MSTSNLRERVSRFHEDFGRGDIEGALSLGSG